MAELVWAKKHFHLLVVIAMDNIVFWIWIEQGSSNRQARNQWDGATNKWLTNKPDDTCSKMQPTRNTQMLLNYTDVLLSIQWQVLPFADSLRVGLPARQSHVLDLDPQQVLIWSCRKNRVMANALWHRLWQWLITIQCQPNLREATTIKKSWVFTVSEQWHINALM